MVFCNIYGHSIHPIKIMTKCKKIANFVFLTSFSLLFAEPVLGQESPPSSAVTSVEKSQKKVITKDEFAARLSSKFQLMKIRAGQLKAMNSCFLRASELVLTAKKKGQELTKSQAMELAEKEGLEEALLLEDRLQTLVDDPYIGNRVRRLLTLDAGKEYQKLHTEFLRLEKEILADLETAKSLDLDTSSYKSTMTDYARNHVESLMWTSLFTQQNAK